MIKRIIEVSNPAYLSMKNRQLVVNKDGNEVGSVPIEDIGILILEHPQITTTQKLLCACWENKVAVLFCDDKHCPGGLLLPLTGNVLQSRFISDQANVSEALKGRIWKEIIKAKIRGQAQVLNYYGKDDKKLRKFTEKIKNGDPENIEGQAARFYWSLLFGKKFQRDREAPGINGLLNYGYAILRAAVSRSIISSGLCPSLAIHHHGQYDSFCLASDLMEPFRPLVDFYVMEIEKNKEVENCVSTETKPELLKVLMHECKLRTKTSPLMTALHSYTASVRKVFSKEIKSISIPSYQF